MTAPARRRAARLLALVLMVPAFALGLAGLAFADVTAVTGSAFGVRVQVTTTLGLSVNTGPTPTVTLPPGGSAVPITNSVVSVVLPGLLNTGLVTASTQGTLGPTGSVQSSAQAAGLTVGLEALPALAIDAIGSQCVANEAGATGSTTVANVRLLGIPTAVSTAPNTVLNVAGLGILHINEQVVTGTAPSQSITVNALRLELNLPLVGTGSIIIGQSVCGVVGDGVVVPTGAVGGVLLTGLVAVIFGITQIRRFRRPGGPAAV